MEATREYGFGYIIVRSPNMPPYSIYLRGTNPRHFVRDKLLKPSTKLLGTLNRVYRDYTGFRDFSMYTSTRQCFSEHATGAR